MKKFWLYLWLLALALNLSFTIWTSLQMPERVANHFDINGNPNGYMSKDFNFYFLLGMTFYVNLVFAFVASSWMQKIPINLINVPHREHWFSTPELTREAFVRLANFIALMAVSFNFIFLAAAQIIYEKNVLDPILYIEPNVILACIFVAAIGSIVTCYTHFFKVEK